jgi:hypothetical protein
VKKTSSSRRLRALEDRAGARRERHRAFDRVPHPPRKRGAQPCDRDGADLFRGPLSKVGVRAKEPPHLSYEMSVSEHIELLDPVPARDLAERGAS